MVPKLNQVCKVNRLGVNLLYKCILGSHFPPLTGLRRVAAHSDSLFLQKFNRFRPVHSTVRRYAALRTRSKSGVKLNYQGLYYSTVRTPDNVPNKPPLPRLVYVQNPLVWFSNKLDFRFLRSNWDPHFNETDFVCGCKQAVSTVTQLVSENKYDQLKPLLTKNALLNLRRDAEILWADEVRRSIGLNKDDIQLVIPRKLHFRSMAHMKFCDIDVVFIGLKWKENQLALPTNFQGQPLIFIDMIVRFHRNYTDGVLPDWTISALRVRRFNVIPPKVPPPN